MAKVMRKSKNYLKMNLQFLILLNIYLHFDAKKYLNLLRRKRKRNIYSGIIPLKSMVNERNVLDAARSNLRIIVSFQKTILLKMDFILFARNAAMLKISGGED